MYTSSKKDDVDGKIFIFLFFQGNVTMQGVDGSTNVFVKKGDVDIQVEYSMSQNKFFQVEFRKLLKI
jgi:hypothetical protein